MNVCAKTPLLWEIQPKQTWLLVIPLHTAEGSPGDPAGRTGWGGLWHTLYTGRKDS